SSKYGSPSLHSSHSLVALTDERAREMKRRGIVTRAVRVKNSSPHSAYSLTGQSDERVREMRRRILHPDSSNRHLQDTIISLRLAKNVAEFQHVVSSKYGSSSLHFTHSLTGQRGERVCEMKRRRPVFQTLLCCECTRNDETDSSCWQQNHNVRDLKKAA
ncbi:hypothetical protein PRIPAC_84417, partial [Pristionchus pacificus]|uniref:Uncharacterized protein n=1 Tax=Pristionchus pacificus TaxID=54126 RepID=A0A2A6BL54_PRIPA